MRTKFCFLMGVAILLYTGTGKIIISDGIDLADDNISPNVGKFFLVCQPTSAVIFL